MQDAAETADSAWDAADSRRRLVKRKKDRCEMGNPGNVTDSMFYAFGAFLLIYIVGASIYQGYLWLKKRRDRKKNDREL